MENRAYALAAGLFMLVFGGAMLAALVWFGEPEEDRKRYVLVSKGNITGLNLEAQVRFRGISAGKVEAIGIDPEDPRNILVTIAMRSDLPVTRGTRASLGYQGVTGLAFIQLEDTGEEPAALASAEGEVPRIALEAGLLDQASDAALNTLERISELADRLTEVVSEENVGRVERSLDKMERSLDTIERAAAKVERTFDRTPQTLDAIESAVGPDKLGLLPQVLYNLELATREATPAISDFRKLVGKLDSSARAFDQFTDSAGYGLMTGTLPRLNALLLELTETSRQVTSLFREVESAPQVLLLGRGPQSPGPGETGFKAPRVGQVLHEAPRAAPVSQEVPTR